MLGRAGCALVQPAYAPCSAGLRIPAGSQRKVSSCFLHLIPLSQACLAQSLISFQSNLRPIYSLSLLFFSWPKPDSLIRESMDLPFFETVTVMNRSVPGLVPPPLMIFCSPIFISLFMISRRVATPTIALVDFFLEMEKNTLVTGPSFGSMSPGAIAALIVISSTSVIAMLSVFSERNKRTVTSNLASLGTSLGTGASALFRHSQQSIRHSITLASGPATAQTVRKNRDESAPMAAGIRDERLTRIASIRHLVLYLVGLYVPICRLVK